MHRDLTALAALALMAVALGPVTRWFGQGFQSLVLLVTGSPAAALYAYHALLLPGTLLHELSHLGAAWLMGVPTGRLSLRPRLQGSNMAEFGSVEVGAADPVRASLIGLAPLLAGIAAIYLVARHGLAMPTLNGGIGALQGAWGQALRAPDAGLWLYVVIAIGNAMLPSASDRRAWWKLALILAAAMALLYAVGALGRLSAGALATAMRGIEQMTLVFALVIIVDLALGGLFWIMTDLVARMSGRRLVKG